MDFLNLIFEASIIAKFVLIVLLFFSVFSWAVVFFKRKTLRIASSQSKRFLNVFRKSANLNEVNEAAKKYRGSPEAKLFRSGFKVLSHYMKSNSNPTLTPANLETVNRALIKAANREVSRLEKMRWLLLPPLRARPCVTTSPPSMPSLKIHQPGQSNFFPQKHYLKIKGRRWQKK